jgi:hypothetical protein
MSAFEFSERDATLIAACIAAATRIVVARHLQVGGDPEKQIAERAYKLYEATINRFELPPCQWSAQGRTVSLAAQAGFARAAR